MSFESSGERRAFWLLPALLGLLILNNYFWLQIDTTPPTLDEADHLSNAISLYKHWWLGVPKASLPFYELLPYPPLTALATHMIFPWAGIIRTWRSSSYNPCFP